jgi:hypothetical protein
VGFELRWEELIVCASQRHIGLAGVLGRSLDSLIIDGARQQNHGVKLLNLLPLTRERCPDIRPKVMLYRVTMRGAVATRHQRYMMLKTTEAPVPKKRTEMKAEISVKQLEVEGYMRVWKAYTYHSCQ